MKELQKMTDEELAVAYIGGDNKAFDILLDRNQKRLFSYIYFMVRNREIADDIFQDTFVKVIVSLQKGEYAPSGKFYSWMIRIAHNLVMDLFRDQHNKGIVDVDETNDMSKVSEHNLTESFAEERFINEQVLCDVKHLMDKLPAAQREVVFMRFFQELSFKEIAETMDISINTALGRMRYAVINLRKMMKQHNMELQLV